LIEESGQLQAPAALSPGKEALVPVGQEARWAPEPFFLPVYALMLGVRFFLGRGVS